MSRIKNTDDFIVTIDRTEMEHRYVLNIKKDGELVPDQKPMNWRDFRRWYKFEEAFPHNPCDGNYDEL
jgi:hypothetical protein